MTIWFWSDQHFGHNKIYRLPFPSATNPNEPMRPFSCAEEADEYMVNNYNNLVSRGDKVYWIGDVAMGGKRSLRIMERCQKAHNYLVLGNHDTQAPIVEYAKYFNKIYGVLYMKEIKAIITHVPVHLSYVLNKEYNRFIVNIHGHSHDHYIHLMQGDQNLPALDYRYYNVAVEATGYRPIPMEEIISDLNHPELLNAAGR